MYIRENHFFSTYNVFFKVWMMYNSKKVVVYKDLPRRIRPGTDSDRRYGEILRDNLGNYCRDAF